MRYVVHYFCRLHTFEIWIMYNHSLLYSKKGLQYHWRMPLHHDIVILLLRYKRHKFHYKDNFTLSIVEYSMERFLA